jgi:hypothetical protein
MSKDCGARIVLAIMILCPKWETLPKRRWREVQNEGTEEVLME